MPGKTYPADVLDQAQNILDAWHQIDAKVTFGDLTSDALSGDITQAAPHSIPDERPRSATNRPAQPERDALYEGMWDKVKRVRSAVRGIYGDDSSQYEMVGGTRLSERKTHIHKKKTTA